MLVSIITNASEAEHYYRHQCFYTHKKGQRESRSLTEALTFMTKATAAVSWVWLDNSIALRFPLDVSQGIKTL